MDHGHKTLLQIPVIWCCLILLIKWAGGPLINSEELLRILKSCTPGPGPHGQVFVAKVGSGRELKDLRLPFPALQTNHAKSISAKLMNTWRLTRTYLFSLSAMAISRKLRCITDEKCQPGMFWSRKV